MANKQNFKPDEWTKILQSTMLAGMAVTAAEPSGLWGALKEAFASSSALAAAKSDAGSNELIKAVVADFETKEGRSAVQEALRKQLAGSNRLMLFSVRSPICERCRRSSMPKLRKILLLSRHGCGPLAKTWQRPLRKVASSASEG